MTARSRFLGGLNSSTPKPPPPPPQQHSSPMIESIDSDFVVLLASLLCALICVLGLVSVARCAWIRRITGRDSPSPTTASHTKGLKKKILKSLPKLTYGEGNEEAAKLRDCAICLADFAAGEEIRVLPNCGHGFHVACIDTWLLSHASCPSCRQILEVARCKKCGRLPPATACSAGELRPEARESQTSVGFYP